MLYQGDEVLGGGIIASSSLSQFLERRTMRLGCHVGISGGLDKALERAVERGCETVQIFISNPRGWRHTPPTPADADRFRPAAGKRISTPSSSTPST